MTIKHLLAQIENKEYLKLTIIDGIEILYNGEMNLVPDKFLNLHYKRFNVNLVHYKSGIIIFLR